MISPDRLAKGLWWTRQWEVLNGCSRQSPACANCFAESYIRRFQGQQKRWQGLLNDQGRWNGTVRLCNEHIDLPLKTRKPTVWFVTERGDIFHPVVPSWFQRKVMDAACNSEHHQYLFLTKRVVEMTAFVNRYRTCYKGEPRYIPIEIPRHIWFGITAENQEWLQWRMDYVAKMPIQQFISFEPLLAPVDLLSTLPVHHGAEGTNSWEHNIKVAIIGCESGPGARETKIEWVEDLVAQCDAAGIQVFIKQLVINGKLEKNITKFAKHLQRRELPWA